MQAHKFIRVFPDHDPELGIIINLDRVITVTEGKVTYDFGDDIDDYELTDDSLSRLELALLHPDGCRVKTYSGD